MGVNTRCARSHSGTVARMGGSVNEGDRENPERRRPQRSARIARNARPARSTDHLRHVVNPFEPLRVLSDDHVEHVHRSAVRFLGEHGIRVLLPEASAVLAAAGATVGDRDDPHIVRMPEELVNAALAAAPNTCTVAARNPEYDLTIGGRAVNFFPVGGPPYMSDLVNGRRPGTLSGFEDFVRLTQSFDVLHSLSPCTEPQDVPVQLRHLVTTRSMAVLSVKPIYVFARGDKIIADTFELVRIALGVGDEEFRSRPHCWTNINVNSPRQLDVPMSMGIIAFARAGQVCIMTPFTLAGAMAPVSLAGALLLQHVEVLAAVTLAQTVRPGAPVVYGAFTSNVDMRSGSPAFGTPEAFKGAVASGQLARHIDLPMRSSGSSSSNVEDAQAGYETMMNTSGALFGGANIVMHAAGWQEGGLCASFEKLVLDVEMLQMFAESFAPIDATDPELAYDAIAEVAPGGHFFGSSHTLERYDRAFYEPLVFSRHNLGQWIDEGSPTASVRANTVVRATLERFQPPAIDDATLAELDDFVARRTAEGGANPD